MCVVFCDKPSGSTGSFRERGRNLGKKVRSLLIRPFPLDLGLVVILEIEAATTLTQGRGDNRQN